MILLPSVTEISAAPLDALGAQPGVDQVLVLAADDHGDMARGEERFALLQLRADAVAAPHRERIAVGVEPLAVKALEGVADRDHEIDGAGEFGREDRRSPPRHHVDGDVRRDQRHLLHQWRHQELDREVGHHQAKVPVAARGVEIVGDEQRAHLVERIGQRRAQRLRPRRQLHPRAVAHQKRIADQVAQPLQRVAGRRLRQIEPHRGAADIGFAQQGVERDQQIEVNRIQIHRVNIYHITYRLEECAARPQGLGQGVFTRAEGRIARGDA
ncbi:hypothetical protein AB7M43_005034 [Bradyrhizobium elkanii]